MKIRKKIRKKRPSHQHALPYLISGHMLSLMASGTVMAGEPMLNPPKSQNVSEPMTLAATKARHFQVPPGPLKTALTMFAEASGLELFYRSELTEGRRTQGVQGTYTPHRALRILLTGTGLQHRVSGNLMVTLEIAGTQGRGNGQQAAVQSTANTAHEGEEKEKEAQKHIKVPEIVVKDVVAKSKVFLPPVDGYKADQATGSTRTALPIAETPSSIGVVTRDIIEDTLSLTQTSVFEQVSGVSGGATRFGRGEQFNIRGFNLGGGDTLNSIRQNGLPSDNVFTPDPAFIERYEIIKGPASIVGGASSPGGVVNRITKRPQDTNFATSQLQGGSYGFFRGVVDANGVLPQHKNVRGRLIGVLEDGGHFVDDIDVRQYTVAPSVEVDLFGGAGTLLLTGQYRKFDGSSFKGNPLHVNGEPLDIPRTRNVGGGSDNGAKTLFEGQNYEAHYVHEFLNDLTLSAKAKYSHSENNDKVVYVYNFGTGVPLDGTGRIYATLRDTDVETYAGEVFVSKEFEAFGQEHEVLLGVDHRDQNGENLLAFQFLGTDNIFNPTSNFQAPSDDALRGAPFSSQERDVIQTGLFGQVVARPIQRLTMVGAFRHDWADARVINRRTNGVAAEEYQELTGRVGAIYELFPGMRVYGGYSQSFEVNAFGNMTVDGSLLPPETGENYEVGAKVDLFGGNVLFTTALFRSYRQNVSSRDPNNPGFQVAIGEQLHQGVEFDINGQVLPGLNLNGNFSYVDAEIIEDNTMARVGHIPAFVPRSYVGRVFATYQLQSGPLEGFGFGGGVFFHGGFELELPNRFRSDPFERVDAVVFYRPAKKIYELQINVRNLLDKTFIEGPGQIGGLNQFGAPVSVFGTLRVKFDSNLEWTLPW